MKPLKLNYFYAVSDYRLLFIISQAIIKFFSGRQKKPCAGLAPLSPRLVLWNPELDPALQMGPHQCWVEQKDQLPPPAGKAFLNSAQEAVGHLYHKMCCWLVSSFLATMKKMLRELGLFNLEKVQGDLTNVYKSLKGGKEKQGARLFSLVSTDRTRSNKQEFPNRKLNLNKRNFFYCEGGQTLEHVAWRGYGVSVLGDIKNLTGHDPKQPDLGDPAWAGNWTRWSQEVTSN